MKAVTARPIEAPRRVQDDPHVRRAVERLSDLRDQMTGFDKRIAALDHASNEVGRKALAQAVADGADATIAASRSDDNSMQPDEAPPSRTQGVSNDLIAHANQSREGPLIWQVAQIIFRRPLHPLLVRTQAIKIRKRGFHQRPVQRLIGDCRFAI